MMASSRSFPRLLLPFSLFLLLPSSVVSLPDTFLPGPYTVDHVHFNKWVIWHVVLFKFFPREIFGSLDHAIDVYAPNTPGPKPVFMFFTGSSSWVRSKLNASKYFRTFWCCTRVGLFHSAQGLPIVFWTTSSPFIFFSTLQALDMLLLDPGRLFTTPQIATSNDIGQLLWLLLLFYPWQLYSIHVVRRKTYQGWMGATSSRLGRWPPCSWHAGKKIIIAIKIICYCYHDHLLLSS